MSLLERQDEIKLDILESLARSQKALASIIEIMAGAAERSQELSEGLLDNVEIIAKYQRALAAKLAGMRVTARVRGAPGKPWLSERVSIRAVSACISSGDETG